MRTQIVLGLVKSILKCASVQCNQLMISRMGIQALPLFLICDLIEMIKDQDDNASLLAWLPMFTEHNGDTRRLPIASSLINWILFAIYIYLYIIYINNLFYDTVDGEWSNWKSWSTCSNTCGEGYMMRVRSCNNPSPAYGGKECPDTSYTLQSCNLRHCPGKIKTFGFFLYKPKGIYHHASYLYSKN